MKQRDARPNNARRISPLCEGFDLTVKKRSLGMWQNLAGHWFICPRGWETRVNQIYYGGNFCAGWLAGKAKHLPFSLVYNQDKRAENIFPIKFIFFEDPLVLVIKCKAGVPDVAMWSTGAGGRS
ncbi:uncharacterized protein LOC116190327 [Punica granatum]|uniref:Uncharacterized protein LOC116190327 n=1 Tax=Punica granatum TaxID=22663 RepID=A0A6P8C3D6_PUNGR|nr:uncharacterized protein LOC116190327 [Punica granatum]